MHVKRIKIEHWIRCSIFLMTILPDLVQGKQCQKFSNPQFSSIINPTACFSVNLENVTKTSQINVTLIYQGSTLDNGKCVHTYCVNWTIDDPNKKNPVYMHLYISNSKKGNLTQLDISVYWNCSAEKYTHVFIEMSDGNISSPNKKPITIYVCTFLICLIITIASTMIIGLHLYKNRAIDLSLSESSDDEELCPQTFEIGLMRPYSDVPKEDTPAEELVIENFNLELKTEPLKLQKDFRTCFLQEIQENMAKFREKSKIRQQATVMARRSLIVSKSDVDQSDSLSFQPASIQELLTLHEKSPIAKGERLQRQQSESSQILGSSFLREEDNEWMIVEYEVPVYNNCVHTVTMETRLLGVTECGKNSESVEVVEELPPLNCSQDSSANSSDAIGYVKMSRPPQVDESGYAKPFTLVDSTETASIHN